MDADVGRERHRGRLIGKLFGGKENKEKKPSSTEDVNAFLHGHVDRPPAAVGTTTTSADHRHHAGQPVLSKIDTSRATRWPTATEINAAAAARARGRSTSPPPPRSTRKNKGLNVHFSEAGPYVIGEGGDEAESPTITISTRGRAAQQAPAVPAKNSPYALQRTDSGLDSFLRHGDAARVPDDARTVPLHQSDPSAATKHYHGAREGEDISPQQRSLRKRPATEEINKRMSVLEGKTLRRAVSGQFELSDSEDSDSETSLQASHTSEDLGPQFSQPRSVHQHEFEHAPKPPHHRNPSYDTPFDEEPPDFQSSSPAPAWSSNAELSMESPESNNIRPSTSSSADSNGRPSKLRTFNSDMSAPLQIPSSSRRSSARKVSDTADASLVSRSATVSSAIPPSLQAMSRSMTTSSRPQSNRAMTDGLGSPPLAPKSTASRLQAAAMAAMSDGVSPSRSATAKFQVLAIAVGQGALTEFVDRVQHLFTLFRLSAESKKPLGKCSLEELVRTALWWFIKGRSRLETSIRDRPSSSDGQQNNAMLRQQAYADLAKAWWILQTVSEQYPDLQNGMHADPDPAMSDILETRHSIMHNLKKLTMSMKRNNILPPGPDGPLQPGLNSAIWADTEGNRSLLGLQRPSSSISVSEAMPLGDTNNHFVYGRMFVDSFLIEDGQAETFRCPCLVTVVRSVDDKALRIMVSNQDSSLKMCIQHNKSFGPTWDELVWRPKKDTIDVKLPRGFKLQLQFKPSDYRKLMSIYEYHKKIHTNLVQRDDEELIYEKVVKSFQYFDQDPQSQTFPKEASPNCQVRFFQQFSSFRSSSGIRRMHRGFRIALVTGIQTKELRGLTQDLSAAFPIQLGSLRGEGGSPALLIKLDDGAAKFAMAFTFDDVNERTYLHSLLVGSTPQSDESLVSCVHVEAVAIDPLDSRSPIRPLNLTWHTLKVINADDREAPVLETINSERLRVIMDFKAGVLTDRVNVGAGELRVRLEARAPHELKVLRQQQVDMTMLLFDAQSQKELPTDLVQILDLVSQGPTVRTYAFPGLNELHMFQASLTGFVVLFDGVAASFNIARRRMVVPIYKKWEATTTRLQVVQREGATQLLAFFDGFAHGDCMNFTVKHTDTLEETRKPGRYSLRMVDAKFPLPKARDGGGGGGVRSDASFVCLDLPEYPGEHDDITVVFDTENELDRFSQALPASRRSTSRLGGTVRR